jgi:hypothetical protein
MDLESFIEEKGKEPINYIRQSYAKGERILLVDNSLNANRNNFLSEVIIPNLRNYKKRKLVLGVSSAFFEKERNMKCLPKEVYEEIKKSRQVLHSKIEEESIPIYFVSHNLAKEEGDLTSEEFACRISDKILKVKSNLIFLKNIADVRQFFLRNYQKEKINAFLTEFEGEYKTPGIGSETFGFSGDLNNFYKSPEEINPALLKRIKNGVVFDLHDKDVREFVSVHIHPSCSSQTKWFKNYDSFLYLSKNYHFSAK